MSQIEKGMSLRKRLLHAEPCVPTRPTAIQPRRMIRYADGTSRPAVWRDEAERQAWLDSYDPNRLPAPKTPPAPLTLDDL